MNNLDWQADWVFTDSRFNLWHCDDQTFLRFLCEMLHPIVRPDSDAASELANELNRLLARDGYHLVETMRISEKPVYSAKTIGFADVPALNNAKDCLLKIDESYLSQQITRMESSFDSDHDLAIGTSKELIETICKTIASEHGVDIEVNTKLSRLVKEVVGLLNLTPEGVRHEKKASDTIRMILGSLSSIIQGMGELRNEYGTGHGKLARTRGLSPRHARLVVGAASTLAVFMWETHMNK